MESQLPCGHKQSNQKESSFSTPSSKRGQSAVLGPPEIEASAQGHQMGTSTSSKKGNLDKLHCGSQSFGKVFGTENILTVHWQKGELNLSLLPSFLYPFSQALPFHWLIYVV